MTLKHDASSPVSTPYVFFLSYAQKDGNPHLDRFFEDLCEEIRVALGELDSKVIGFRDKARIEPGHIWSHRLDQALSTSRAFVPLYSPTYFKREYCGKEWSAFRSRLDRHQIPSTPSDIPLIIPIFWMPLRSGFTDLPESIRAIQYHHPDLGDIYCKEGLRYLLRVGKEQEYQEFLTRFTQKLLDAIDTYKLPPAEPALCIEGFPNAFEEAPAPRKSKGSISRKQLLDKLNPRDREPRYVDPLHEERARRDDFLTLVERVCALREPALRIERVDGPESWGDYLRVSSSSGGLARIYPVGAVEQNLGLEDLQRFIKTIDARYRRADSGLISHLVYGGDPAPEALLHMARLNKVYLVSFIEYQGLIDFRPYIERQTRKLEEDPIYRPDLYIPQRLALLIQRQTREYENALETLQSWLLSPQGRFALILGDFGTGKTFILHELARKIGKSGEGPTPILLQMRSLEKGRSLNALIAQHFALEELGDFTIPKFRYMLEQGRIALLFDGFDELALRVTYERATEHFDTLLEAAKGSAKVVITSRRQHFLSEQQVLTNLGKQVELITGNRIGILQPFNESQIRGFLVRHCGNEEAADTKLDLIHNVKDLLGLSANPRMLGFIAELPEKELRQAAEGDGKITAATLYQLLMDRWLGYEYDRIHPKGALPGLSIEDRWKAVTTLALRLWQKTDPTVNLDELREDASRVIQELDRVFDPAVATFQVGSGTLLVRDEEGNFSFLHQSILEFLVAQAAAEEIKKNGSSILLSKKPVSLLMIQFLKDLIGRENVVAWARQATRGNDDIAKKNALLILDRLQEKLNQAIDLSGQDLSGQNLSEQNLEGANLERANLSSARLIKTRLRGARLVYASLRDADLTHADLGQTALAEADLTLARLLGADLREANFCNAVFERAKLIGALLDETSGTADFFGSALRIPDSLEGMTLFSSSPLAVAWHPERDLLASAEGSVIRLWDPSTGQLIRAFQGHQGAVSSVVFSPEGNTLASASYDKTVRLWDTATGQEIRVFQGHQGVVLSVVFSPDGNTLASASYDKTVRLWDTATGREIRVFQGRQEVVMSVAFSPDASTLASASSDGTVRLWDTASGREIRAFQGHRGVVRSVVFSPDGNFVASASDDKTVRLWNTTSGQQIRVFQGHQDWVRSLAFNPEGNTLASASGDETIRLWDTASGRELLALQGHKDRVYSVAFSSDGHTLASSGLDTVRLWETNTGREIRTLEGDWTYVSRVVFIGDRNTLASVSGPNTVRLWETNTGREIRTLDTNQNRNSSVVFSPDGSTFASASFDKTIHLWETASGREIDSFKGHKRHARNVTFSPDGTILASDADDNTIRIWEIFSGREIRTISAFKGPAWSIAISHGGRLLAASTNNDFVHLWNIRSGRRIWALKRHRDRIWSLAFSPDGKAIVSTSDDETVRLWETASGQELWALGQQGHVSSVVFSPDGTILACGSNDSTVRLVEAASGRKIRLLEGHQNSVNSVTFSSDGNTLASASHDNTVRLWDVATGRCIVILVHLPEGWVAFTPDGRYKYGGVIAGGFWHAINLCRFEVGELDEFVPGLRLPDDASFFDLPPVPPWVQKGKAD